MQSIRPPPYSPSETRPEDPLPQLELSPALDALDFRQRVSNPLNIDASRAGTFGEQMARRRLHIDSAELFALSVDALATRYTVSTRTIKRLREAAKARTDSVVAERIAKRAALNTAVRSHKKRQRAAAITSVIITAISPAVDNVEPVHSTEPAPPALFPAPPFNAGHDLFDSLAALAALPQAVRYFLDGGSIKYLFDSDDDSPLVDDLIDGELETWLIKCPETTTEETYRHTFDALSTHPSTIAFALHPADGAHVGTHMHVVSVKSDPVGLAVLQRDVNGHPPHTGRKRFQCDPQLSRYQR